jgi:hypothetical protein
MLTKRRCSRACGGCARPHSRLTYSDPIAEVVGAALAVREHSVLADQLRYALDYRVVIERAVGYLMGTHSLDAVTAFNILRRRARDSRRRVAGVAAEILEQAPAGGPGELPRTGTSHA